MKYLRRTQKCNYPKPNPNYQPPFRPFAPARSRRCRSLRPRCAAPLPLPSSAAASAASPSSPGRRAAGGRRGRERRPPSRRGWRRRLAWFWSPASASGLRRRMSRTRISRLPRGKRSPGRRRSRSRRGELDTFLEVCGLRLFVQS